MVNQYLSISVYQFQECIQKMYLYLGGGSGVSRILGRDRNRGGTTGSKGQLISFRYSLQMIFLAIFELGDIDLVP